MQLALSRPDKATLPRLTVRLAQSEGEVRQAQQLRWQVFAEEQGARLASSHPGYDIDEFDVHCEHLLVIEPAFQHVVGTYRLLTSEGARRAGGYYSETEFDLSALKQTGLRLLEVGRACVLPQWRSGATISLLWSGLAEFLIESRHDALIGCASIPLTDRHAGARLAHMLSRKHPAPAALIAEPHSALPGPEAYVFAEPAPVPPLIKGYLRSGAMICSAPCWDPDFNCADLLIYLPVDKLTARYARRFLPDSSHRAVRADEHLVVN